MTKTMVRLMNTNAQTNKNVCGDEWISIRLTLHIYASHLAPHGLGVELAHVAAVVGLLQLSDVDAPGVLQVVADADPRVGRHHLVMHRQDGAGVGLHPAHLGDRGSGLSRSWLRGSECALSRRISSIT